MERWKPGWRQADTSGEDRSLLKEICELQNKHLGALPKKIDDRTVGMALEENMDVLREIACKTFPDPGYITEKTCAMIRDLKSLGLLDMELPNECKLERGKLGGLGSIGL